MIPSSPVMTSSKRRKPNLCSARIPNAIAPVSAQRRVLHVDGHLGCRRVAHALGRFDRGSQLSVCRVQGFADRFGLRGFVFVAHHKLILAAAGHGGRLQQFSVTRAQKTGVAPDASNGLGRERIRGNPRRRSSSERFDFARNSIAKTVNQREMTAPE